MIETFAVDVGGTFTDIVALDTETGDVTIAKTPTISHDPSQGVLNAIEKARVPLRDAKLFFHGTTLGVNTVLERKGARTGLIATKGFGDELEIGRLSWPMYQLHWDRPPPIVPRSLRREVNERILADGTVLHGLDEAEVKQTLDELVSEGVESIAVCFLHAYRFSKHEKEVGDIIAAEYPGIDVSLSHLITQQYREFERTATTVVDANIKPGMTRYIKSLESSVRERGFSGQLLATRCDGGVMSVTEAAQRSVRTLLSGPASGVMGAVALGEWLGVENSIAIDMGGTSFDCALIIGGEPILGSVAHVDAGVPLLMPVIEMATIGAGGGSIARIDVGGGLDVGPESAGAAPGPICYGKGGTEPTFTDAALASGLIDAEYFLGGEISLDAEAACRGIGERIARPLSLSGDEAASGIIAVAEAKMAATLEGITIAKGHDPRDFTLLAYGGGGPLVASDLAAQLEIPRVVVPRGPATFSAWGMLTLDIVHDFSKVAVSSLQDLTANDLLGPFTELQARAVATLDREEVPQANRRILRSIDMRYENQEHTLTLPLASMSADAMSHDRLRREFDERHKAAYGYAVSDPVDIVAYGVRAVGTLDKPRRPSLEGAGPSTDHARKGKRRVLHRESGGEFEWTVYDRGSLGANAVIRGPAIVEEPTSTTLVPPGRSLSVDSLGNLVITHAG